MINNEDKKNLLKVLSFWEKISTEEQNLLINNSTNVIYKKGETVHNSVNNCTGVLIVKKGLLRVYILSEEGRDITLYRMGKGDVCILSVSCILKNITFDIHIDAEEESKVILMNSDIVESMAKNIYIENFLLKEAVNRFSDVMWTMEQILFMKLDQRLAVFLLDESVRTKSIILKLSHEQIAKHLGSAREVVSRMLKYFVKEGLVEVSRGEVKVLDKVGLKRLI